MVSVLTTSSDLQDQLNKVKALEKLVTFRVAVLSKRLDQQVVELLADTPLNLTSYRVMRVIETFEAISISDISRYIVIDRGQVSRTAMELARLALVEFRRDDASKRKKIVALTGQGQALMQQITPRFDQRQKALIEGLGEADFAALTQGLNKLARVLSH